jgi:hypothetical protein
VAVKTYSPKDISIIVAGTQITGFAEDSFLSIERSSDAFVKVVGADGEVARTASADKSGTITITLLQSSSSNDVLSALQAADEISLTGKFPLLIKDHFGTSIHEASTAWVMKVADAEYGAELGDVEWTIECADLTSFVGGNTN